MELLSSVLQFLTSLLAVEMHSSSVQTPTIVTSAHSLVEASQLVWLVKITCHEGAVCVQLVHSCLQDKQNSIHQRYSVSFAKIHVVRNVVVLQIWSLLEHRHNRILSAGTVSGYCFLDYNQVHGLILV